MSLGIGSAHHISVIMYVNKDYLTKLILHYINALARVWTDNPNSHYHQHKTTFATRLTSVTCVWVTLNEERFRKGEGWGKVGGTYRNGVTWLEEEFSRKGGACHHILITITNTDSFTVTIHALFPPNMSWKTKPGHFWNMSRKKSMCGHPNIHLFRHLQHYITVYSL